MEEVFAHHPKWGDPKELYKESLFGIVNKHPRAGFSRISMFWGAPGAPRGYDPPGACPFILILKIMIILRPLLAGRRIFHIFTEFGPSGSVFLHV